MDWAGAQEFWAAGQAGLIYRTTDGGQNWQQFVPTGQSWTTFSSFEIEGLAFGDVSTGVFVGSIANQGKAFLYQDFGGGNISWTDISPAPSLGVTRIFDVAIATGGAEAWAVARRLDSLGVEKGILLTCQLNSSSFTAVSGAEFDACNVGDDLASVPVLNRVAVAPGGKVWMGGECGRVWRYDPVLTLVEDFKSQTDAHVRGISFTGEYDGFR